MTKRSTTTARTRRGETKQGGASASDRAAALKTEWAQLGRRHVLVGGACACGHGQSHLRPEDFEYFVLDHLVRKYRAAGQGNLVQFVEPKADAVDSIERLLERLAQPDTSRALSAAEASLILDDLQRSLESFADSAI